jgi:hypothetical protein
MTLVRYPVKHLAMLKVVDLADLLTCMSAGNIWGILVSYQAVYISNNQETDEGLMISNLTKGLSVLAVSKSVFYCFYDQNKYS